MIDYDATNAQVVVSSINPLLIIIFFSRTKYRAST